MSELQRELDEKRRAIQAELDKTSKERVKAAQALDEARKLVQERQAALDDVATKEGRLHGSLGELDRMQDALDTTPD